MTAARLTRIERLIEGEYGTAAITPDDIRWMLTAVKQASVYATNYVRDEADRRDCCVSDAQHRDAIELFDALGLKP